MNYHFIIKRVILIPADDVVIKLAPSSVAVRVNENDVVTAVVVAGVNLKTNEISFCSIIYFILFLKPEQQNKKHSFVMPLFKMINSPNDLAVTFYCHLFCYYVVTPFQRVLCCEFSAK